MSHVSGSSKMKTRIYHLNGNTFLPSKDQLSDIPCQSSGLLQSILFSMFSLS